MDESIINPDTGEIVAGIDAETAAEMRACDQQITDLDRQIADTTSELKCLKMDREAAVAHLRSLARDERRLPFETEITRPTGG